MASADLRAELECSICLNIYTDPVMLRCGHNFCRVCIDCVLDTQERSGGYSCPECREKCRERPTLQRNIKLRNIVETFLSAQPDQEESGISCTHCVDTPVPAVKFCLHCEVYLCEKHLKVHKKSPEHVLTDPAVSLKNRKCLSHQKILEYYCTKDSACICVSCRLDGEHKGHQVESLDEAFSKKKQNLTNVLQKLIARKEETERRLQGLEERKRKVQERAEGEAEKITNLFKGLRRQLEDLEEKVLSEISRQAKQVSFSLSDLIQELELKKDELSLKMCYIEELCNVADPLTFLQESGTDDLCDTKKIDHETQYKLLHDEGDLDMTQITDTLHAGLSNIMTEIKGGVCIQESADLLLDVNTAGNKLHISDDKRTVSRSDVDHNRPDTPERFRYYPQVLSMLSFGSGCRNWEMDVGGSRRWSIGMCYPSIDRTGGGQTRIGSNNKSWCLVRHDWQNFVIHDSKEILLPAIISSNRVRMCLKYEAGQLSFYDLCDPIQHLHTFTTTFTEPLYVVLGLWGGCIKICGGGESQM